MVARQLTAATHFPGQFPARQTGTGEQCSPLQEFFDSLISIIYASKMAHRFCHFCAIQQKQPMTSFLSWAYGGKKGIRTLEGFRGPTRFPVVRLRPAQPSFHIFSCAAPDCMSYYSNTNFKCQDLFCIFLQKNLRWARCMQNVRANCIFCTFYPLANGGARC